MFTNRRGVVKEKTHYLFLVFYCYNYIIVVIVVSVLLYNNNCVEMLNRRAFSRAVHVTSGYTFKHTHRLIMLFCHPHAPMVSVYIRVRLLLPFRIRILRVYPVRTMLSLWIITIIVIAITIAVTFSLSDELFISLNIHTHKHTSVVNHMWSATVRNAA